MHRFLFNDICKWDKKKELALEHSIGMKPCLHPSMATFGIFTLLSVGVVVFFSMEMNANLYPKGD